MNSAFLSLEIVQLEKIMKRTLKNGALALLGLSMLNACSNNASDDSSFAGKMTQEQEQALEKWIQSPIKSCQAIEVMGGGATQVSDQFGMPGFPDSGPSRSRDAIEKGVDLGVLATRTKGSLWIGERTGLKDFAVLSGASTPFTTGVSETKFEQSIEINGRSQSVKVEAKSSGYDCVVTVNGVERAKVKIAKNVEVGLAGGRSWQVADFRQRRDQTVAKYSNALELQARDVLSPLMKGIQIPASRTQAMGSVGYSQAEAEQYFPIATSRRPAELAIESSTGGRLILSDYSRFVLLGQDMSLVPEVGGPAGSQTRDVSFVLLLKTEKTSIGGQSFKSGTEGVMGLKRVLRLRSEMTGAVQEIVFQDTGFGDSRLEKAGVMVADRCVIERADDESTLYSSRMMATGQARLASYQTVFSPCSVFDEDVSDRAETNGLMLKVLNVLFARVSPSASGARFEFGDWAQALVRQIELNLKDLKRPELSESGASALASIDAVVSYARQEIQREAQQAAAKFSNARRSGLAGLLLRMAEFEIQDPRELRARQVSGSIARLAVILEDAFDLPLFELMRTAERDLSRAASLAKTAETLPASYVALVKETYLEAQAIGHATYLRSTHARLFELLPSERELQEWTLRFRGVRTELQKYPSLKGQSGGLVEALLASSVPSFEYANWIKAGANLASGAPELLSEIVQAIRSGGATDLRNWAIGLPLADQQGIASYIAEAKKLGQERQAMEKVLGLVRARSYYGSLARLPVFATRANAFYQSEVSRAQGSYRDTFFESRAKDLAGKILIEEFEDFDVKALEVFAKVAAAGDLSCDGRQTISLRLECAGLERFKKSGGGLLNPKFQGRYVKLAERINVWMGQLVPETDHRTIRRRLKEGLYPSFGATLWETCDVAAYQTRYEALDKAVGKYFVALGDFITRSRIEREVSTALDSRCP